jgi:transposase
VGQVTVKATPEGHLGGLGWAGQWAQRRWAIQDCRHLARRLERDLLAAGEPVVGVPPRLMAGARRGARTRGKSDPIDALAVARAALREPGRPVAHLDGVERQVRLLVDHRQDLVAERTRAQNRLRWHLQELEPGWEVPAGGWTGWSGWGRSPSGWPPIGGPWPRSPESWWNAARELTARVNQLQRQLKGLVAPLTPSVLGLSGCGTLTAAKLVRETAGVGRFRSRAALARHNGTAPVPVWSANRERHRLHRGGNRQLNAALHRIAVTQLRRGGPGLAYYQRRIALGDTKTKAIRALGPRISEEVYRRLAADEQPRRAQPTCQLPAA